MYLKRSLIFLIIFGCHTVFSKEKKIILSEFQKQISQCELNISNLENIKNFPQLYSAIQKKYVMLTEKILYQELYFNVNNEKRKIKVTNDSLELFRIEKDEVHTLMDNELRQKNLLIHGLIKKLTLNAKIEKDWKKSLETFDGGLSVETVRVDEKITHLKIFSKKKSKNLDCEVVNSSEICLCNKS
jgi:general stress protein 26